MEMKKYNDIEHRHYDSVAVLIDDLGLQYTKATESDDDDADKIRRGFYEEGTIQDAVRESLEGRAVKEFASMYDSISNIVAPKNNTTSVYDVVGGFVDIGAFMSGEPECMVDFMPDHSRGKSVTLAIQFNDCGGITAQQLLYKGAVACCVAETLNALGVSTRIVLVCWNRMSRGEKSLVTITLSDYGQRFDVYQLSGTASAPNFWRRILFAYLYKYYSNCGASLPDPPPIIYIHGEELTDTYYIHNVAHYSKSKKINLDDMGGAVKLYKHIMDDIEAKQGINYTAPAE